MDYQKELMEIKGMRDKAKVRRPARIRTSEEFTQKVFKVIKSALKEHIRAKREFPFHITIDIMDDENCACYALGKAEDQLWTWYCFLVGTSKVKLKTEMLEEICKEINKIVAENKELQEISAHISKSFCNLVISIN